MTWAFRHDGHNEYSAQFLDVVFRDTTRQDNGPVCPGCGEPPELDNGLCLACNMIEMDEHINNIKEMQ